MNFLLGSFTLLPAGAQMKLHAFGSASSTSGSFAVGPGILMFRVLGFDGSVAVCRLQSRRADGFDRHRIVVAAAGVCRSTQTASAAHSRRAPSAQTSLRSRLGYADVVRRAPGA